MAPALLYAAAVAGTAVLAVLAWQGLGADRRLAGIWAFSVGRPREAIVPFKVLRAPASEHAYLATPVIDRRCYDVTLAAMLDALAAKPDLPKTVMLNAMSAEAADALESLLRARGGHACRLNKAQRPVLAGGADPEAYWQSTLSASSRKKLRQYRRRLGERGTLQLQVARQPEDVREAAERFLQLEANGWKGQRGTALLSQAEDAAFTRTMLGALAAQGQATIYSLVLDGQPVSMQIVLRAGATAFTWKTAYDEGLSDVSPGMLLFEDYTKALLAEPGIATVDSCAYDDRSFMASWSERRTVVDMMFDVRRGALQSVRILGSINCAYRAVRMRVKNHWHKSRAGTKSLQQAEPERSPA
jgi:CelD/BcsL family acetyltransferase involved in cellulose biosynthesis